MLKHHLKHGPRIPEITDDAGPSTVDPRGRVLVFPSMYTRDFYSVIQVPDHYGRTAVTALRLVWRFSQTGYVLTCVKVIGLADTRSADVRVRPPTVHPDFVDDVPDKVCRALTDDAKPWPRRVDCDRPRLICRSRDSAELRQIARNVAHQRDIAPATRIGVPRT